MEISDSMSGPAVASPSDAQIYSLEDQESDLYAAEYAADVYALDAEAYAVGSADDFVNVLRFDVVIDGTQYTALFSPEYADSLYIDSNNLLWNVSTSTIQGRLLDDSFNPDATTGKLIYLTACLGNNFSTVRNYGSPNYIRDYYWSGNTLSYTTTYVNVEVLESHSVFKVSDTIGYIVIVLLGGCLVCLWRKSLR